MTREGVLVEALEAICQTREVDGRGVICFRCNLSLSSCDRSGCAGAVGRKAIAIARSLPLTLDAATVEACARSVETFAVRDDAYPAEVLSLAVRRIRALAPPPPLGATPAPPALPARPAADVAHEVFGYGCGTHNGKPAHWRSCLDATALLETDRLTTKRQP